MVKAATPVVRLGLALCQRPIDCFGRRRWFGSRSRLCFYILRIALQRQEFRFNNF